MLEKLDLSKKIEKEEYKQKIEGLRTELGELQRKCRESGIPVMIAFEGYGASGKGVQIGKLIQALDPRGFRVYAVKKETEEERLRPFLWRFWTKLPEKGRIAIYDTSWYRRVLLDRFAGSVEGEKLASAYDAILAFERQLVLDGMAVIKIFLVIDRKEQKKRFEKLCASPETAWRVSRGDWKRNRKFQKYEAMNEEMLSRTDTEEAPWNIVEATDRRYATVKIYSVVIEALKRRIEHWEEESRQADEKRAEPGTKGERVLERSVLAKADLSLALSRKAYKKELRELQDKVQRLHGELYRRRIPVVLAFEGWDAAGKGGAIRRLTDKMDPRGYVVHPTAAPNAVERQFHYLWRFWKEMPKAGHIAVFDRTWYGRVLVERVEGFCTEEEWKRAYQEINAMERTLSDDGVLLLKFWMQIDRDEQERRFIQRRDNPEKQWKITEEDWRNREKWEQYEEAVDEMLIRTSTPYAPWIVVEGNDKYYARIKVLRRVAEALESRMHSGEEERR